VCFQRAKLGKISSLFLGCSEIEIYCTTI
jgi:hypothetical protein